MKVEFKELIYFVFGIFITTVFFKKLSFLKEKFFRMTRRIRLYSFISIVIVLISIGLNIFNYLYISNNQQNYFGDLINFYSGLSFAIFTGYFAFTEFQLNRFEKLVEEARGEIRRKRYSRAQKLYEQANLIKPTDSSVISDLTEIYLISGDEEGFEKMVRKIDCVDRSENILVFYLQATWYLLDQNFGGSKKYLKNLATHIVENPEDIKKFSWNFSDIQESEKYINLTGESKEILTLLINMLEKKENQVKESFLKKFQNN